MVHSTFALDAFMNEFCQSGLGWFPMEEVRDVLPEACAAFAEMLNLVPEAEVLNGRYSWPTAGRKEKDQGIIRKWARMRNDETAEKTGRQPDNKVYFQDAQETRDLFVRHGLWRPEFDRFFTAARGVREHLKRVVVEEIVPQLIANQPTLAGLRYDDAHTVLRCLQYLDPREDDPQVSAQDHLDKNDLTCHLWESCPGLVIDKDGGRELVPTRPHWSLMFAGSRLERRMGVRAIRHGARYNGRRQVAVAFIYFEPDI